jgi:hypothetical protein
MESSERSEIEMPSDFMDANIDHIALLIGFHPVSLSKFVD